MGNILKRRIRSAQEGAKTRVVSPNHLYPEELDKKHHPNYGYANNRIKTTKYSALSFIPKNLFEQFHRFANLYFVFIVVLNWIPEVNAFAKEASMLPVIFVLIVTAVKDAYEDYRRYKSDFKVNRMTCRVFHSKDAADRKNRPGCWLSKWCLSLEKDVAEENNETSQMLAKRTRGHFEKVEWQHVSVGDIVHLSCNEVIPADIILLHSSDPHGICHIDTSNIDGENNLKQREIVRAIQQDPDDFDPASFKYDIECDVPNRETYKFHGHVKVEHGHKIPLTKDNFLLRGCILRNTDFIKGIVLYAGHETKALMNNRGPRYKRSKMERQINKDVIWSVIILFLMCFLCALGNGFWMYSFENSQHVPFIPYESIDKYSPGYQGFLVFWTFIIVYQVMIPLSLYVSIELVKLGQAYFMQQDLHMYHENSQKGMQCQALNINEDLGQVQYIFSDKTGTLTENQMIFKRCSIWGKDYAHDNINIVNPELVKSASVASRSTFNRETSFSEISQYDENFLLDPSLQEKVSSMVLSSFSDIELEVPTEAYRIWDFFLLLTVCNTVVVSPHPHVDNMDDSGNIKGDSFEDIPTLEKYSRLKEGKSKKAQSKFAGLFAPMTNMFSAKTWEDDGSSIGGESSTETSMISENTLKTRYEAESPDELALVKAACSYGCRLMKRMSHAVILWLPGEGEVEVKLLHVLPFDAVRKCMSVIVQHPGTNETVLYCKGADSAIMCNLKHRRPGDEEGQRIYNQTLQHLTQYAKQGLRTLCMAKRVLTYEEYKSWLVQQNEAECATEHQERRLHEAACAIEMELQLLGCTGIEDRLQDGVPETVAALREAGIKMWVLTGDKQETALNIAYSCNLISYDQQLIILNAKSKDRVKEMLQNRLEQLTMIQAWSHDNDGAQSLSRGGTLQSKTSTLNASTDFTVPSSTAETDTSQQTQPGKSINSMSASHGAAAVTVVTAPSSGSTDVHCATPLKKQKTLSLNKKNKSSNLIGQKVAMVIDGKTLGFIIDLKLGPDLVKLAKGCDSVLCCRAAPYQKATLVRLVKDQLHQLTLAIGDGANDVSMIQTADIGVGISGQEGMQAVMSADFALARFRFLRRLLMVHGHWCYDRLARMTLFMFYKNCVFIFILLWYQFFNGFSGSTQVDQYNLIFFNLLYTSVPPLVLGIFNQDLPEHILMAKPHLYRQGPASAIYKPHSYFVNILDALWQSLPLYFTAHFAYMDSNLDIWEFGTVATFSCVLASLLHMGIETHHWNIFHWLSILGSIALMLVFNLAFGALCVTGAPPSNPHWVTQVVMSSATDWCILLLGVILALAPRYIIRALQGTLWPSDVDRARQESRKPHESYVTVTKVLSKPGGEEMTAELVT